MKIKKYYKIAIRRKSENAATYYAIDVCANCKLNAIRKAKEFLARYGYWGNDDEIPDKISKKIVKRRMKLLKGEVTRVSLYPLGE